MLLHCDVPFQVLEVTQQLMKGNSKIVYNSLMPVLSFINLQFKLKRKLRKYRLKKLFYFQKIRIHVQYKSRTCSKRLFYI